jgi:hypothetical protein
LYAYPKNSIKKYGSAAIILNDLNQDFELLKCTNNVTAMIIKEAYTL